MLGVVCALCGQGVLRFVDIFADLPLWADLLIVSVVSVAVSVGLLIWRRK